MSRPAPESASGADRGARIRHRSRALVEEAPAAYRDIGEVLAEHADLARPVMRLEPLAVLKGR